MKVAYIVDVSCVDDSHYRLCCFDDPTRALKFLREHDHEGANVSLSITADAEGAYLVLMRCANE